MRYKAILFDMDGTLLDTLTDMADAVNHILSVHGWPLRTTEEVRAFVGNGARRLMERAVPPEVTGGDFETVLTEYRDWYQAHNCVATAPYPGIPALLAALAEGKSLHDAARFANALAAISVQRMGTTPAMPTRAEIDAFLAEHA